MAFEHDCCKQDQTERACCPVHVQVMLTVSILCACAMLCARSMCKLKDTAHSSTLIAWGCIATAGLSVGANPYLAAQQVPYTIMLKLSAEEDEDTEDSRAVLTSRERELSWLLSRAMCLQGASGTTAEMTMQPAKLNPGRTKKVPCSAETPVKWPVDFLYLSCQKAHVAIKLMLL